MNTLDWINSLIDKGIVSEKVSQKISECTNKVGVFRIAQNMNAYHLLCCASRDGFGIKYEDVKKDFPNLINNEKEFYASEDSYPTQFFCETQEDDIFPINATLVCFLGCKGTFLVEKNAYTTLFIDKNSDITIEVDDTSSVKVRNYGGKITIFPSTIKVDIANIDKEEDDYEF